jgi:hypothetical protein
MTQSLLVDVQVSGRDTSVLHVHAVVNYVGIAPAWQWQGVL